MSTSEVCFAPLVATSLELFDVGGAPDGTGGTGTAEVAVLA